MPFKSKAQRRTFAHLRVAYSVHDTRHLGDVVKNGHRREVYR